MTSRHAADKSGPRHARFLRSHRVARTVGLVAVGAVAAMAAGGLAVANHFTGNIQSVDAEHIIAKAGKTRAPKDPSAGNALNILVLGSDKRDSASSTVKGERSDTTMVMHVSSDRQRIDIVSIPRDTMVDVPSCVVNDKGTTTRAQGTAMFNSAFAVGSDAVDPADAKSAGALCTWQTVEHVTGLHLDGFVVVDFDGFKSMIDALGGVSMCIPEAVDSPKAGHLKLEAGYQELDGATALKYARARKGVGLGDGSDLQRIGRQQAMVAAVANEVLHKNLLTDSVKLGRFLNAATKSLTMSDNLSSLGDMVGLAYSLRSVRLDDITLVTIPWTTWPQDPNRVMMKEPEADEIWSKLAKDEPIYTTTSSGSTKASGSATKGTDSSKGTGGSKSTTTPKPSSTPQPTRDRDTQGVSAADAATSKAACG